MSKPKKKAIKKVKKSEGFGAMVDANFDYKVVPNHPSSSAVTYPPIPRPLADNTVADEERLLFLGQLFGGVKGTDDDFTVPCSRFEVTLAREFLDALFIVIRKNRDYGASVQGAPILAPQLEPGVAMDVRMSDKIKRLIQLSSNTAHVHEEAVEDTKLDLAAYVLLQRAFNRYRQAE